MNNLEQAARLALDALENCRLYAARHRDQGWAEAILRFCAAGGHTGSPFRAEQAEPVVDYTLLHDIAKKDGVRAALELKDKLKQQAEPVLDKIKHTHTAMTRFDFEQRPDHEYAGMPHRVYTQSSTDGCYLCACLAEIDRLKQAEPVISKDAYDGAREDLAIWKIRALKAEELNRKFVASVNSQTFMGEPVQAEPVAEPVVSVTWSEVVRQQAAFCDRHCTWLDHASDCPIGNPSY
jgi:hypothetical protein